ncbi:MAG: hypothetical protein ACLSHP_10465 [Coprococcus sp.]
MNEKDEEIIWKYCCTEIAFYLAWLVENEFLTLDPVINETIEKVKKDKQCQMIYLNVLI